MTRRYVAANVGRDCHILHQLLSRGDKTKAEILKKMSENRFIYARRELQDFGARTWKIGTVQGKPPTYTIVWKE